MKKIITNTVSKVIMLLVFISVQATAWASEATSTDSVSRAQQFFSMPSVWIAIAGIIVFVGLAFFTGNKKHEQIEV